ncbi:nitric oxide synthase-like [Artemia franciscana]|uniref:nitric oxide synthase-like n=1 Tax=Artemia franciscana TaxID=6661 RepID=UPI0032DA2971
MHSRQNTISAGRTYKMKQHANNEGIRLKNWSTGEVLYDTLHSTSNVKALNCRSTICTANHMNTIKEVKPIRTGDAVLDDAKKFIDEFYASIEKFGSAEHLNRWSEIKTQIEESDGYIMKTEELKYGATVAWRNAPRCPGRIQWKKLQVFDSRHVGTAQGMFEAMCTHLQYATNGGILRSAITVFPPRQKGRCDFRVWNSTMIGYACYKQPDGTLLGDPFNLELTQAAQKLGWAGKGTRQDILPLIVQAGDGEAHFFDIPEDLVLQVPLRHPKYEKFTDLGYKWFALPGVSCLKLDCGGLEFSAIPFSGWYSDSEIGSRDLGDKHRFNLAPVMAGIMGLNTETNESNWRDLAVSELVVAVAHSFREAKITIVDHQTACETFIEHFKSEHEERGGCPTDWVWVNPPGSFTTPVYHQEVLFYWIKPLYDYQDQPWKTYNFGKHFRGTLEKREIDYLKRFRHMARAALFAQRMFMKAYANRTKAMILYATETGKSLGFAKQLAHVFSKAFKPEVMCMKDYDVAKMEFQDLILVVASTFVDATLSTLIHCLHCLH